MTEGVVLLPELCGEGSQDNDFWSDSLTLNTSTPDLTVCFQRTVLLWIPCGWLWGASVLYYLIQMACFQRQRHGICNYSYLNFLKMTVSSLITLNTLIAMILLFMNTEDPLPVDKMYYIIRFFTMALATVYVRLEYVMGVHSSGTTFLFWLLQFLCDIFILRSWVLRDGREADNTQYVLYCIYFGLVCIMFILHLFPDYHTLRWSKNNGSFYHSTEALPLFDREENEEDDDEEPVDIYNKKTVPELYVPFWQQITFLWITGNILGGYNKPVTFESLYHLRPFDRCKYLVPKFYNFLNLGRSKEPMSLRDRSGEKRKRRSFLWSAFLAGGYTVIPSALLRTTSILVRVCQPLILGMLIDFVESDDPYTWKGLVLAAFLFFTGFVATISLQVGYYLAIVGGMRVKSIACASIYRKALRLSGSSKKLTTVGEIVNLMAVDAQKLEEAFILANTCWEVPLQIIVCTSVISTVVGSSVISGVVLLCLLIPLNGFCIANWIRKLQSKQMEHKDTRIKYISEILSGIKIIKLYAWEIPFLEKVFGTRTKEVYYLRIGNIISAIGNTFWVLAPFLVSLAIFGTYVFASPTNILNPNVAFVTMSLINILYITLATLPLGTAALGRAIVSLKRINRFLDMEELDEDVVETDYGMSDAVTIEDGSFSWEKDGRVVLSNIDLKIPRGQLVAVVGHVGSGKTSLISALLGEMARHDGYITLNGSLAYVPQQAWIQNATLRDNILFGKGYRRNQYDSILDATALLPDLKILPDGDMTEIGEKGINLSGGQKQRVSLARAVYQKEDIYLLDDPLSAVDAHVGKHIFERVISNNGLLRDKTRILVTHGVSFLPHVDVIIVMNNGVISEMGPFNKIVEQNGDFAKFLESYFNEKIDDLSEEEEEILAIHSQVSGLSASDNEKEGHLATQQKLRKRRKSPRSHEQLGIERTASTKSETDQPMKLIEEEIAMEGNLRGKVIWSYVKAGGQPIFYITLLSLLLFSIFMVGTNFWLSTWSSTQPGPDGTMDYGQTSFLLGIYGTLGLCQGIFAAVTLVVSANGCVKASAHLHENLLNRLLRAPMSFFDTTPLGRIMNRCSKDIDYIDSGIPFQIHVLFFSISPALTTVFIISYTTPLFLIACIPIVILYAIFQQIYIKYVRQLKRVNNIRQSPIYAHFDETLNGTSSIRAYRREEDFTTKCDRTVDDSQRSQYMITVAQRWLGIFMETAGNAISFFAALFAVLSRGSLTGGLAGLSISQSLNVTALINVLVRSMTELETMMVSVERVEEYCHVSQEADWRKPETETDGTWPANGKIIMEDYGTRYRPGLDLVLDDLSCNISAGEKIGIVGRTGAGKSSLALALFRIIESARGSITIDGVPIASLGLHNLRTRLTIIPQDPVIFSGSLRQNLDPLSEYREADLWKAVEKAHLKAFVDSIPEGLDYDCGEGGESLSVGQRQLVCLGRAILRQTKVLVLDEATAAVDLETDSLIQTTIRDVFKDSTILTIAHRLVTVLDYDRIMVLDNGSIKEFDSPQALMLQTDSIFYGLAKEAGVL